MLLALCFWYKLPKNYRTKFFPHDKLFSCYVAVKYCCVSSGEILQETIIPSIINGLVSTTRWSLMSTRVKNAIGCGYETKQND